MSFIGNALGVTNGYVAQNGASAGYSTQLQNTENNNLVATYGNQSTLAQQLQAQANGQGPNVAQAQLNQATSNNNKQAAGQAASVRGMNPAIAQRQIAQNAAAANQNAAGQSATLRAQQQLAAQGAEANVYGQQGQEMVSGLNTLAAAQTAANTTNAQTAQSNQGLFGSIFAHGGEVKALPKHLEHLSVKTGSKVHPIHLAQGGGLLGSNFSSSIMGIVKGLWGPGAAPTAAQNTASFNNTLSGNNANWGTDASGLSGGLGTDASGMGGMAGADAGSSAAAAAGTDAAATESGSLLDTALEVAAHGGEIKKVDAMVSPGERYIPPHLVEKVRTGKLKASQVAPKFPGKPKVQGDSEQNDTIPTKLAPGGVVIKRSKADNDADAREFLQEIAKEKAAKTGPSGYAKVLQKRRQSA